MLRSKRIAAAALVATVAWLITGCEGNSEPPACTPSFCSAHGDCDDSQGAPVCHCHTGYQGTTCDACADDFQDHDEDGACLPACPVAGLDCGAYGTCDDSSGTPSCLCEAGLSGESCDRLEAPANLSAQAGEYSISLTWEHPVESGIDFQVLRKQPEDADYLVLIESTGGDSGHTDESILLEKTYQYAVRATAGNLVSVPSGPVSAAATGQPRDWTLVYFISSDGNYPYTYMFNVDEMEAQGGSSDEVPVLVLYDGFDRGDTRYMVVGDRRSNTQSGQVPTCLASECNMGAVSTYRDFIDWMLPRYQAKHYLVSFHDHGGGSVEPRSLRRGSRDVTPRNMLWDQTSGDSLDPDEQGEIIAYLAERAGQKVDVVESMVCLGQMIENTFPMAGHADFHIGAESVSYVTLTFPIDYLEQHPQADGEEVASWIVTDHHEETVRNDQPCHWSMVDLDQVALLSEYMADLAGELADFSLEEDNQALLRQVAGTAQNFSLQGSGLQAAYVDIKDLAARMAEEPGLPQQARDRAGDIVDLFDEGQLVRHNFIHNGYHYDPHVYADYTHAFGLSVYHPSSLYPTYVEQAAPPYESLSFSLSTGWADYLRAVGMQAATGQCPQVDDLLAEQLPDGSVRVSWNYPEEHFHRYDGFFCSRYRDGEYSGVYHTVMKSPGQTAFEVIDDPQEPGVYTWNVTAIRFAQQAESANWTLSNPVEIEDLVLPEDVCSEILPLAAGDSCYDTATTGGIALSVVLQAGEYLYAPVDPWGQALLSAGYTGENHRSEAGPSAGKLALSLVNPTDEALEATLTVEAVSPASQTFVLNLVSHSFSFGVPCEHDCKSLLLVPAPREESPYRLVSPPKYMFGRRELVQACVAGARAVGESAPGAGPVGIGDLSQADGEIPGTDVGAPRHPEPSHRDGFSADVAYYRTSGDNLGTQPACQTEDSSFCTGPHDLDLRRNVLFMLELAKEPRTSQIIVDPVMEPDLRDEIQAIESEGLVDSGTADRLRGILMSGIAYHTDHFHIAVFRECSDGMDNDGDGATDLDDPDCAAWNDDTE